MTNTHENKVMSLIKSKDPLIFYEFNSTFNSSVLKDFKDFFVLRDRGKLFQSLTVLTAKVRLPPDMFLWRGTVDLNYNFLCFSSGYQSFSLKPATHWRIF